MIAQQIVDRIDPDGTVPQEQLGADRRYFAFRKTGDGMFACEGRLTGAVGAKLDAVLGPLSTPRTQTVPLEDGREVQEDDLRHHGQRMHDALEEVCDRQLRSGTWPDSGGTPASVIITIDEADLYPSVVNSLGVVLRLGRTRRLASCGQTVALIARDGGCSFRGCDRPPEWCQRHHVLDRVRGGRTDLQNLTLLCAYHHHSFASRGWTCVMIDDQPAWIPPKWVDREQRPLRNARVLARQHGLGLRC